MHTLPRPSRNSLDDCGNQGRGLQLPLWFSKTEADRRRGAAFDPSGAPPVGQNTETRVSLDSQLTGPSACTARMLAVPNPPWRPFLQGPPVAPEGLADRAAPARPEHPGHLARPEDLPVPWARITLRAWIFAACSERKRYTHYEYRKNPHVNSLCSTLG